MLFACWSAVRAAPVTFVFPCRNQLYFDPQQLACRSCAPNSASLGYRCQCLAATLTSPSLSLNYACNTMPTCPSGNMPLIANLNGGTLGSASCVACQGTYDSLSGLCTPCGIGQSSLGGSCVCSVSSQTSTAVGCFNNLIADLTPSQLSAFNGCINYKDPYSCSYLANQCLFSLKAGSICAQAQSSPYPPVAAPGSDLVANMSLQLYKFSYEGKVLDRQFLSYGSAEINLCSGETISNKSMFGYSATCAVDYAQVHQQNYTYLLMAFAGSKWTVLPVFSNKYSSNLTRFFLSHNGRYLQSLSITANASAAGVGLPTVRAIYSESSQLTFSFAVEFVSDSQLQVAVLAMMIVATILALGGAIFLSYSWVKSNPQSFVGEAWAGQLLITFAVRFMEFWAIFALVVMFVLTGACYFVTKYSSGLNFATGGGSDWVYVVVLIGAVLGQVVVWHRLARTSGISLFLVDWEKNGDKTSWRQIFILRNFVETAFTPNINYYWVFLWTSFLLNGVGVQGWASADPLILSRGQAAESPTLLAFLGFCTFLGSGFTLKVIKRLLSIWWPYRYQEFMDLCSVANLSLLVTSKNSCQAYYIHARNSVGAESSLAAVNRFISEETKLMLGRGVQVQRVEDFQTYTFYLTRDMFETIRAIQLEQHDPKRPKRSLRKLFCDRDLKILIPALIHDHKSEIKSNSYLHSCVGLPPVVVQQLGKVPVLVADPLADFTAVFPSGHELKELCLLSLVFVGLAILTMNGSIAAGITLGLQLVGKRAARTALQRNLAQQLGLNVGFLSE